jgi:hypothetical protein
MTGKIVRLLLEIASIAALLFSFSITLASLYGHDSVRETVPMTNAFSNHPSDWGTRATLLQLPAVQLLLYAFGAMLAKFSGALRFPVQVTTENRLRLQVLAESMISWLKAELITLLAWIQWIEIGEARGIRSGIPPLEFRTFTLIIFATALIHYISMRRQVPT